MDRHVRAGSRRPIEARRLSFVIEVMEPFAEELPARSTARSLARLRRLAARSGALRRYRRAVGETRRAADGRRRADEPDAAPGRIALRAG